MKLCLINPPEIPGFVSDRDKAGGIGVARPFKATWRTPYLPPTPALDLLYAAAIAEREGIPVSLVDAIGRRLDAEGALEAVRRERPTHIGLRVSMPSLEEDLAIAERLKAACPDARVFLFGHATQTTYATWRGRTRADAVFFGEVEALLLPYLRGEGHPNILVPAAGAVFASAWAYVEDLDALPVPAWHLVDVGAYSPTGRIEDFVFYLLTSRGCPKGCSMCPYYVHQGKQWRFRSAQNVADELSALRRLGARHIQTRDPNISWRKAHLLAIAERLQGETQFRITTETDLEALNESDLQALRSAGFVRLMTGVESVDPAVLKDIHQTANALNRSLANMAICERLGLAVTGFFIVGSLNETWASVKATVETARRLPIDYSVSLMTPYFGTAMREEFVKRGFYRTSAGFKAYNGYTGIVRTEGLSFAEVVLAHAWAAAELELVTRERRLARSTGARRLVMALRCTKQRIRTLALRARVLAAEAGRRRPDAAAATP